MMHNLKTGSMIFLAFLIFSITCGFTTPHNAVAEEEKPKILELVLRPNKKEGVPADAILKNQILKLVLNKTKEKYGDFTIKEYGEPIQQSRVINSIAKGTMFRVIATMTSPRREQKIWPIRIPLYKGLFGHRIFIIREEDQAIFSAISNVEELKKLIAIQGHDWPDSEILEANDFTLQRSPNYQGIFQMLRLQRADYFPRGAHEPWSEVERHRDKKLAVEKHLLIRYDAPFYFFVRYGDEVLYKRLREGLLMAIEDGSFDALFYNHPDVQDIFKRARISSRKIFRIPNPTLNPETPVNKKQWWYSPGDETNYLHKGR
ncbi:MAG: amino acid ABC transporter substrate-binding protein [Desulfobulbaceae bacterium]|nr:amino acid ABC transporter substrate-binding protein [Desulfobulbaceae bacterium]